MPTVPLKSASKPGVIVTTADGDFASEGLAADERDMVAAADMLGEPAADAVGVPCDPLYTLPLM